MAPILVKRITESEQKQFFQAWTVFMCATALLVLSAIGWMLR